MTDSDMSATSRFAAARYSQLWESEPSPPDLDTFLSEFPDISLRTLVDVLLVDQQRRWERNHGRAVEDYLRQFPAIATDPALVADLLYGECLAIDKHRGPIAYESLLARFPDLADRLANQLEVRDWLSQAADKPHTESVWPSVPRDISTESPEPQHGGGLASATRPLGGRDADLVLPAASRHRWQMLRVAVVAGALSASVVACVFAWWWTRSPHPERMLVQQPPTHLTAARPARFAVAWTFDAFRGGDLERRDCLTAAPAPVYAGDAFRMTVTLDRAAHVYAYTIDSAGQVALIGAQSHGRTASAGAIAFPPQEDQAIAAPTEPGTLLCVLVLRDTPLPDPKAVAPRLRPKGPWPTLAADTLLVDGSPLTAPANTLATDREGIQLAQVLQRLGDGSRSRAADPSRPLADQPLAEALTDWYAGLPDDLGDVHYLAVPVAGAGNDVTP